VRTPQNDAAFAEGDPSRADHRHGVGRRFHGLEGRGIAFRHAATAKLLRGMKLRNSTPLGMASSTKTLDA
jgi:hypothetical protein